MYVPEKLRISHKCSRSGFIEVEGYTSFFAGDGATKREEGDSKSDAYFLCDTIARLIAANWLSCSS